MPMNLVIEEVEIEGFRYVSSKLRLKLDYDVVLLLGPVGSGKSTVLSAIEFALFGTTYDIKSSRVLRVDDLVNDFSDYAYVRVRLRDADTGDVYEVIRRKERGKASRVRVYVNGKQVLKGASSEAVASFIESLLGLTLEDFSRQAYIRARELEALTYGTPSQRSEAIDRLFGIEMLEDIFRSVSPTRLDDHILFMRSQAAAIEEQLRGVGDASALRERLAHVEEEAKRLKAELAELEAELAEREGELKELESLEPEYRRLLGLKAGYETIIRELRAEAATLSRGLDLSALISRLNSLRLRLADLLVSLLEHGEAETLRREEVTEGSLAQSVEMLEAAVATVSRRRRELSEELSRLTDRLAQLRARRDAILSEVSATLRRLRELEGSEREYRDLASRYGEEADIQRGLRELESRVAELAGLIEYERAVLSVAREVVRRGERRCPVCRRELSSEDILRVKRAAEEVAESEYAAYLREYDDLRERREDLLQALDRLRRLREDVSLKRGLEIELGRLRAELKAIEDEIYETEAMMDDIRLRLDEAEGAVKEIEDAIKAVRDYEEYISTMGSIKRYESKLRDVMLKLRELKYDPERKRELESLVAGLRERAFSLRRRLDELRRERDELAHRLARAEALTKELSEVRDRLKRLEQARERLVRVKQLFRDLQAKVRAEMLRRVVSRMNEVFRQVYVHPDYDRLDIRVEVVRARDGYARSVYEIYAHRTSDGSWVPALRRMSDGQRAILALSFLAALFMTTPHNVGTMMLDEPLPNIDEACKEAMVRMLSRISGVRQIVIATQDPRFVKVIEEGARERGLKGIVYEFSHGPLGPVVKVKE